ncbi:hypothetical protein [Ascidiaceihabitans sp.]|uniref:hypothetical protein n=1 Tax=Ascidiaceihabitans sp. TaxID=1872644 RepID=UPI00329776CB
MTTMDRVRVYAAVAPQVTIDKKTAQVLCTLADVGVKACSLEQREAQLQIKAKELLALGERLKQDQEDLAFVRRIAVACFALGISSALLGILL